MIKRFLCSAVIWLLAFCATGQTLTPVAIFDTEPGTSDVFSTLLSSDGQHLYTFSSDGFVSLIAGFSIDQDSGSLSAINSQTVDCGFLSIRMSSDGSFIFYQCRRERIGVLGRNLQTGELSLLDDALLEATTNQAVTAFAISNDSRQLYVTGFGQLVTAASPTDSFVATYQIAPGTGDLTEVDAVLVPSGNSSFSEVFLSPDDRHVYVMDVRNMFSPSFIIYRRNFEGGLTRITEQQLGFGILEPPSFADGGKALYVFGSAFSEPVSFTHLNYLRRDQSSGLLTREQGDVDFSLNALSASQRVAIADNERLLYMPDSGIRVYRLSPLTGEYTLLSENLNNDFADAGLSDFSTVVTTFDGRFLYATFPEGIAQFTISGLPLEVIAEVPLLSRAGVLMLMSCLLLITFRYFNKSRLS